MTGEELHELPIQGLWIGSRLSTMERLSVASFLKQGHTYHLYAYDHIEAVPKGTILRDAGEVLPRSAVFRYTKHPSFAGFANFFRYKLLLKEGGWWADTDVICLKPFVFDQPYVFASEMSRGRAVAANAVIRVPKGSAAMALAWECCAATDPKRLVWGETGPKLMAKIIDELGLHRYQQPANVFCPIPYSNWNQVIDTTTLPQFPVDTVAVHLWNEMWRRAERNKDAVFPAQSLYERLKRAYLEE